MSKPEAFLFKDQYLLNRVGYNMSLAEIGFTAGLALGLGVFLGWLFC